MKQQLSKFFKPITVIDWVIFAGFILLNIAFCVAYFFIRLILAASIKDFFPPDYAPGSFFKISPLARLTTECILAVLVSIETGVLIRKLRLWLLSLPIQYLLCFTACYLFIPNQASTWVLLIAQVLIAQLPGVVIGLFIRYLLRKLRARKQQTPA